MHRNKSVDLHQFSMVPRAEIPRSSFRIQKTHKTTINAGNLYPIYVDEVLPGDTHSLNMTIFARMSTPIFPVMDNLILDSFFFFVPNRLIWDNWVKFMGEQQNPNSSIAFTIPQVVSANGGFVVASMADYFGLPTVGQVLGGNSISVNALPFRAYNLIWNQWFRDENLQSSQVETTGDGPDTLSDYVIKPRGKRHDYFTSCLPWTQKGGVAVTIPLGSSAPVKGSTEHLTGAQTATLWRNASDGVTPVNSTVVFSTGNQSLRVNTAGAIGTPQGAYYPSNLIADLTTATAATINQLRQSFQIQRLLERDARGGTRYTEIVRSHFGVISPDARLQRTEYLGGGASPVNINPIAQTSATGLTGGTSPLGGLSGFGTLLGTNHGFTQSFTEHGYIVGLISVRADLTYQQGIRKMWSRSTRYDFYFPVFAHLGEQAVLNKEIYADGSANDALTFGYQERWAEYRHNPSQITGKFRSTTTGTLDAWHLAQKFTALPVLNGSFMFDDPPMERVLAAGVQANDQEFLVDMFFDNKAARPLPLYSVPGLIDHL